MAGFGGDISTPPFRLRLYDKKYIIDSLHKPMKLINFTLIPGMTNLNMNFEVLDYYNENIQYINGSSSLEMRNIKDFSLRNDGLILIEGVTSVSIVKGKILNNINIYRFKQGNFLLKI